MLPRGVEEKVILGVAPVVDIDRVVGRSGVGDEADEGLRGGGLQGQAVG